MDDLDHRIHTHMRRIGADQAHHTDPLTHATTRVLRDVLNLVRAELRGWV